MTTIRQIITDAYREAGIIGIEETLDSDKFTEGLRRFNVLFDSLFENELGESMTDLNYGKGGLTNEYATAEDTSDIIDNVYVPSNSRLFLNLEEASTIYLNPRPRDGARFSVVDSRGNLATYNLTINPNGRKIEDASSLTLSTNNLTRSWFYRADTGNWTRVTDFVDGDNSPLPHEFDDLLVMFLAVRLNPRHGAETSQEMVEALKRIRRIFRTRYRQYHQVDSEIGLYRLPSNKYWRGYY